jgi:hypothetical protein
MVSAANGKLPALRRGTFLVRQGRHTRRGTHLQDAGTATTPAGVLSFAIVSVGDPCHWPACNITVNGQTWCDEGRNRNG